MAPEDRAPPQRRIPLNKTKLIAGGVSALIILIVVLQNTAVVETKILFLTVTMPRAALLIVTLGIGFGLGYLVAGLARRKAVRQEEAGTEKGQSPSP